MRRRLATLVVTVVLLTLIVPVATASAASSIHVRPGQSIQDAIDRLPDGGVIHVARGTYSGNLEIKSSRVHLVGDHATIEPGAAARNLCDDAFQGLFVTGICIHGNTDLTTEETTEPVFDVSVKGFTVRGFDGYGIVGIGAVGLRINANVTTDNVRGMWFHSVKDLSLLDNRVYANHGDGVMVQISTEDLVISGNDLHANRGTGIMILNSVGARITDNHVYDNCGGIVAASSWNPTSTATEDVSILGNRVTANNRWCTYTDDQMVPDYGGVGIALIGAQDTTVERNVVRRNREQQPSSYIPGGGIVMIDGGIFGGTQSTGSSVRSNRLSGNSPYDIYGDGSGSGNTVSHNRCHSTNLGGC